MAQLEIREDTLQWVVDTVEDAYTQIHEGKNAIGLNQLGQIPVFNSYINYVKGGVLDAQHWAGHFPNMLAEAEILRTRYEREAAQPVLEDKVNSLTEQVSKLTALVTQFVEAASPAAPKEGEKPLTENKGKGGKPAPAKGKGTAAKPAAKPAAKKPPTTPIREDEEEKVTPPEDEGGDTDEAELKPEGESEE